MRPIIVTMMLGMNRFTQRDTAHPFNMRHLKGYNTMWLPEVSKTEKKASTPFYEITRAVDEIRSEFTDLKDDIAFIFGRGTIGDRSEEALSEALLECGRSYGYDSVHIMVTKSYGAVDTLRALRRCKGRHFEPDVRLFVDIDGYGPRTSLRHITKCYKEHQAKRFIIPENIHQAFGVVQRTRGFYGLMVGSDANPNHHNFVVKQKHVDDNCKYYDHYSDDYRRRLKVRHKNMEEIVSVVPCCQFARKLRTVPELVKIFVKKAWS